ncbi:MAG: 30S ribosomal protein S21 [Pseudomonadales bacterium]|jgi:ribosomal protein S21|nr:30S ribosomal protein S21 [Pseudomonadales bacterium]
MAIVVKARKSDSTNDLIKKFKKLTVSTDVVQIVKDRQYFLRPSQVRKNNNNERRRLARRLRGLKKMKNISPDVITRMHEKLSTT